MNAFLQKAIEKIPSLQSASSKMVLERIDANPNALFDDFDAVGRGILGVMMPFIYSELRTEDFYNAYEESGLVARKSMPEFGLSAFMYMKAELGPTDEDFMADFNSIKESTDWRHRAVKKVNAKVIIPNIMYSDYLSVLSDFYYHTQFNAGNGFEMILSINAAIINLLLMDYSKFRSGLYADALSKMSAANDLQPTQTIEVSFADTDNITPEEAKEWAKKIVDFKSAIKLKPSLFNEEGFNKSVTNLKYFCKPGFAARLKLALTNVFNPTFVSDLFANVEEIPTLGKISTKYNGATVYPVYSTDERNMGQLLGYSTTEGGEKTIDVKDVDTVDDDKDLIMIAVDPERLVYMTRNEEYSMPVGTYSQTGAFYNQFLFVRGSNDGKTGAALYWDKLKTYVKFVNKE